MFDNLWTDPLSVVVGLYISPCTPSQQTSNVEIKLAGKHSGAYAGKVIANYDYIDMGFLNLSEFYGNFMDYKTQMSIYIPFVGVKPIDINCFMGGRIHLRYLVDYATGTAVAYVSSARGSLNGIIYQFECNIYSEIPLTYQSANALKQSLLNAGIGVVTGNPAKAAQGIASSATNALFSSIPIETSGRLTTNAGFISSRQPYLIIQRPMPSNAAGFKSDRGYMSNVTARLGDLNGYTEVYYCNLSGISCTEEERERLMNLLKTGVYL